MSTKTREQVRQEAFDIQHKIKELEEDQNKCMDEINKYPGSGVDSENYPLPNFPHYEQAKVRAKYGENELLIIQLKKQLEDKMAEYFQCSE